MRVLIRDEIILVSVRHCCYDRSHDPCLPVEQMQKNSRNEAFSRGWTVEIEAICMILYVNL